MADPYFKVVNNRIQWIDADEVAHDVMLGERVTASRVGVLDILQGSGAVALAAAAATVTLIEWPEPATAGTYRLAAVVAIDAAATSGMWSVFANIRKIGTAAPVVIGTRRLEVDGVSASFAFAAPTVAVVNRKIQLNVASIAAATATAYAYDCRLRKVSS